MTGSAAPPPAPDAPGSAPPPPAAPRRSRWLGCLTLLLLVLLALGAAGWIGWRGLERWARTPHGAPGPQVLRIAPGTPARAIAGELQRRGLVSDARRFLIWARLHGHVAQLQAGEFALTLPIAPERLAERLAHGAFVRRLVIPEGWTARQIGRRLARDGWVTTDSQWLALVARPLPPGIVGDPQPDAEGFLFPETYALDDGTTPGLVLERMLATFRRQWQAADPARRDPRVAAFSQRELVILASLLEREARVPEELPRIASVYLNRLARGMKLQCCATVYYALGEAAWSRPLRYADLSIDSPYNTYRHRGLPPGPIANPGRPALEAVLRPAAEDFLFYVYAGQGHHIFSRTFNEHQRSIRQIKKNQRLTELPAQDAG